MGSLDLSHLQRHHPCRTWHILLPPWPQARRWPQANGDPEADRLRWRPSLHCRLGAFVSPSCIAATFGLTVISSLVALQAGGYTHPWTSAYTLCTLLIGIALLVTWFVWEWKFARHPMVPFELFKNQRVVGLAFAVAFVAGMNFFSVRCLTPPNSHWLMFSQQLLNFWPLTIANVWNPDPVSIVSNTEYFLAREQQH